MKTPEYNKIMLLPLSYKKTFDLCQQSVALFDSPNIESADRSKGILIFTEPNLVLSDMPYSQHRISYRIRRINTTETSVEIISKNISFSYMIFGIDANQQNINRIATFFQEQTINRKDTSLQRNQRISNPLIIACFSLLIPGLGQYWNDQMKKGIMILIMTAFSLLIIPELGLLWWGLSIIDAFFIAIKRNKAKIKASPVDKKALLTYIIVSVISLIAAIIGWSLNHGMSFFN